jgi:starvation-inducible DNA-binding protein
MSNTDQNLLEAMKNMLADSYILFLKTQNYHWNVTGPHFASLHGLFEEQYRELFEANDEIAERIRAMGHYAPGSFEAFKKIATVEEEKDVPDSKAMIGNLAKDHEKLAKDAQAVIDAGEAANDDVCVDMGVRRREVHQKAQWMLNSHLA